MSGTFPFSHLILIEPLGRREGRDCCSSHLGNLVTCSRCSWAVAEAEFEPGSCGPRALLAAGRTGMASVGRKGRDWLWRWRWFRRHCSPYQRAATRIRALGAQSLSQDSPALSSLGAQPPGSPETPCSENLPPHCVEASLWGVLGSLGAGAQARCRSVPPKVAVAHSYPGFLVRGWVRWWREASYQLPASYS